jgi:hypothetical protein
MATLNVNGKTYDVQFEDGTRSSGSYGSRSGLRERNTAAESRNAAPARFTSTAKSAARA